MTFVPLNPDCEALAKRYYGMWETLAHHRVDLTAVLSLPEKQREQATRDIIHRTRTWLTFAAIPPTDGRQMGPEKEVKGIDETLVSMEEAFLPKGQPVTGEVVDGLAREYSHLMQEAVFRNMLLDFLECQCKGEAKS